MKVSLSNTVKHGARGGIHNGIYDPGEYEVVAKPARKNQMSMAAAAAMVANGWAEDVNGEIDPEAHAAKSTVLKIDNTSSKAG